MLCYFKRFTRHGEPRKPATEGVLWPLAYDTRRGPGGPDDDRIIVRRTDGLGHPLLSGTRRFLQQLIERGWVERCDGPC